MHRVFISVLVVVLIVTSTSCTREKPPADFPGESAFQAHAPSAPAESTPTPAELRSPSATPVVLPPVASDQNSPNPPALGHGNPAVYTVQPGDWLSKVSRQFNISNDELIRANPGINPNLLVPGQQLKIPNAIGTGPSIPQSNPTVTRALNTTESIIPKKYVVQRGDWYYAIARRFNVSVEALRSANPNINPDTIYPGMILNIPDSTSGNSLPSASSTVRPTSPPQTRVNTQTRVPLPTSTVSRTPTPVPSAAVTTIPPNALGYGLQLNWTNVDNDQEMTWLVGLGFGWVKAQVRWCDFEPTPGNINYGLMDQLIRAAGSRGIHVMLSVVCAPNWSRADGGQGGSGPPDDLQKAADFMANLASRYCGTSLAAIEVWNEPNLAHEWHGKTISAALYLDMLRRSYVAIRARCPSALVISGGLTPTGVTSSSAIDDLAFLQQMYSSGLRHYSDAVGAHPSGFCNSPDSVEGAANPCNGQFNDHRSFFFRRTLESYRAVMVQNGDSGKRIWVTEFGWAVDPSPKPGYEYARFLTEEIQAAWNVRAFQNMKAYGYVGVAFLWNLDFTDMNHETGAFHILNRRAYDALKGMVK